MVEDIVDHLERRSPLDERDRVLGAHSAAVLLVLREQRARDERGGIRVGGERRAVEQDRRHGHGEGVAAGLEVIELLSSLCTSVSLISSTSSESTEGLGMARWVEGRRPVSNDAVAGLVHDAWEKPW